MFANQRVKEFIKEVGIQDILKKTNLGQSLVYKLKDTGGANSTTLEEIFIGFPNLSSEWIFKGIGKMWKSENYGEALESEADYKKPPPAAPTDLVSKEEIIQKQMELLMIEMKRLNMKVEILEDEMKRLKRAKK